MEAGLTTTCRHCKAEVSLETMTRLRDLTCPYCHLPIRTIPNVDEPALVVIHGEDVESIIPLQTEVTFGRAPSNTMTLREMKASRQHAIIKRNGSQFIVKDLKSANGTYVNDQLVSSRVLSSGDLVRIADSVYLFRNPRERASVTSKLGARFSDGNYQTEAEVKFSDHRDMMTIVGAVEDVDIGKLQKANEKLRIIYDVTTFISSILDLEVLLERILDIVFEQIPAERGAIFLKDSTGELDQRVVKKRGTDVEDRYMEISKTIINKVVNDSTSVLTTDTMQDDSFSHAHSIISQGIRQAMSVPLVAREELLGLIHIDTTRMSRAFNQDNLQLLTGIAGQAAIAIQNARLLEKIENETRIRGTLERYLAPELVEQVVNKQLDMEMGGQTKKVTIMFCDIRGFTPMAERISAHLVVETLNRYFEVMVDTLFQHGGMLDKFIGDSIMAVWGLPIEQPNDALNAVRAAMQMQVMLYLLNFRLRSEGREEFRMGVGINTGDVVSGNMGSSKRREYGVIGSTVNLAARIETLTKQHQVHISENTYHEVKAYVRAMELEPTTVKGIEGQIKVFCVMGVVPEMEAPAERERRLSPRIEVFFPVTLTSVDEDQTMDGVIVDISSSGAAIDVLVTPSQGVAEGSKWEVEIDVYGLRTLSGLQAQVERTEPIEHTASGEHLLKAGMSFMVLPDEVAAFFRDSLFIDRV